jgi:hypothetical protein
MAIPATPNTTCEINRAGTWSGPFACHLQADYRASVEMVEAETGQDCRYTHVLRVDLSVDIRDPYDAGTPNGPDDRVWVPDRDGTEFDVAFVARIGRGTANDHKAVYLLRARPTWPSNEL